MRIKSIQQKWLVMISVAMGVFLGTIDGTIVNVALPTLVTELNATFQSVQWVVLGYMLTQSILLISMGRLADIIGKKQVYQLGMVLFTISSALCGLAPNIGFLIACRVIQAIGGSMLAGLGMAIVTESFPPEERGKALGILGTVVTIGIMAGPAIGGLILSSFSWRWIFYVNIPIGFIGFFMFKRFVPNSLVQAKQKFDFAGAFFLLICLLSLLLALTFGQTQGFLNLTVLVLFGTSIIALVIFLIIENRVAAPMIDLTIFKNPLLSINLLTGTLVFMGLASISLLMPFYLQNILSFGMRNVGLLMATNYILIGVVAPFSGTLSDRYGSRLIVMIGLAVMFITFLFLATMNETITIIGYILHVIPVGLGLGIFQSPNNSAVLGSVTKDKLGVTSSMLSLTRVLGQTIGISVFATIWSTLTLRAANNAATTNANTASVAAQIQGLQSTFLIGAAVIAFALILSFISWRTEQKQAT